MRSDYSVIVGATLTLLGLLIGFTFSMATTRYDMRNTLRKKKPTRLAPKTPAWISCPLRTQRVSAAAAVHRSAHSLRYHPRPNGFAEDWRRRQAKKVSLVTIVAGAAKLQPSPLSALASSGMNDVLNAQGYTQAAWWNRIPTAAWLLMFLIAALANVLLGYGMHDKSTVLYVILPLAVSISFFLIADIDSPRTGVIRIQPQNLYALADSLKAR